MVFRMNIWYHIIMEIINLKTVSPETRKTIKKQVISLIKKGRKQSEIAETVGISPQAVKRISSAYKKEGAACLKEKKRGRKFGEKRQLTPVQEKEIRRILIDKPPDRMELSFMLWTRAAVCQLVEEKYGITITLRNMSEYLKRWGMTCQRPARKAYFQDNVKLDVFMHETYPAIVNKAKTEDAVIFWGDETGIDNQAYHVSGFAPKGQTPVVPSYSKVEKINMISAVSNHGRCHFLCYEENMTQQRFIDFMERLVKDTDRKVLFIVDNLKVHHGKMAEGWLSEHKDEIELFFTSPYSPEINPDEYLNHSLKQNIHSGIIPHTREQIRNKTEDFMHGLQKCEDKASCYFRHQKLKYIEKYGY